MVGALVPAQGCHLVLGQFEVPPAIGEPCVETADCGEGKDVECIGGLGCSRKCETDEDCLGQGPYGTNSGGTANACLVITTELYLQEQLCLASCESAGDCARLGPGYGCVTVVAQPGPVSVAAVCFVPDPNQGANGDPCTGSSSCVTSYCYGSDTFCSGDCTSSAECAGMFVGGTNVFGGSNACVDLGQQYGQCAPTCTSSDECQARYGAGVPCVTTSDVGGATVSVCVPP